jgi:hypothetical protein
MDLTTELKNQYRNPETWVYQIANVLKSLVWAAGTWLGLTTIYFGMVCMGVILFTDWVPGTEDVFREQVRVAIELCATVALLAVIVFGLPSKVRNVFQFEAERRVQRWQDAQREEQSRIETTERLLRHYNLITQDQINERKGYTRADT